MKYLCSLCLAALASLSAHGEMFRPAKDIESFSITMVREFPLVAVTVNGVAGKLMFDTGQEDALSLNDQLVPLEGGKVVGKGVVGSGQSFVIKRYPEVAHVEIDGTAAYRRIANVKSQDLSFIAKGVTPDFLGFLGHRFYEGYLFKLDYQNKQLTFYRQTEARRLARDYLDRETVLAELAFETRKLPNHPIVRLTVGGIDFVGAFDTGQMGSATISKATQAELSKQHLLTPLVDGDGSTSKLDGIAITPTFSASVSGIRVREEPSPAAKPMGTPEANLISFGYAFLKQFKTVWDFDERKIYLLKERPENLGLNAKR